jgi:hypothetical protein
MDNSKINKSLTAKRTTPHSTSKKVSAKQSKHMLDGRECSLSDSSDIEDILEQLTKDDIINSKAKPLSDRKVSAVKDDDLQTKILATASQSDQNDTNESTHVLQDSSITTDHQDKIDFQPETSKNLFPKDIPINHLVILSQYNTKFILESDLINNQIKADKLPTDEWLDKTIIRGFELNIVEGGSDILSSNELAPFNIEDDSVYLNKFTSVLDNLTKWLVKPNNTNEVLFLNLDKDKAINSSALDDIFKQYNIMPKKTLEEFVNNNKRYPSIQEIKAQGYSFVEFDFNESLEKIIDDFDSPENKTTSEVEDTIITTFQTVSNDYKGFMVAGAIEEYSSELPGTLKTTMDLKNKFTSYSGHQKTHASKSTHLPVTTGVGINALAAGFTLLGAGYQAYLNEQFISTQDKTIASALKEISIQDVINYRIKNKVSSDKLYEPVTTSELVTIYKKEQAKTITKNTILSPLGAIIGLISITLAIGFLMTPLLPIFATCAVAILLIGLTSIGIATYVNKRRLMSSIDKALDNTERQKTVINVTNNLNANIPSNPNKRDLIISAEKKKNRLEYTSTALEGAESCVDLVSNCHYLVPVLSLAATGTVGAVSIGLVGLSAALNYRKRRENLEEITNTTLDLIKPEYDKKPLFGLWIFGETKFNKFIKSNSKKIISQLNLPADTKPKAIIKEMHKPENEDFLNEYAAKFSHYDWKRKLTKFNERLKPEERVNIDEIHQDKTKFKEFYKKYLISKVGKYAYRDTLKAGIIGTLSCVVSIALVSTVFFPILGLAIAGLILGLTVSSTAAQYEEEIFKEKLESVFENNDPNNHEQSIMHDQINSFIDDWIEKYQFREEEPLEIPMDNPSI